MTIEVPSSEPAELHAGTTVAWTKSLPDYPATTYTLTYYFINGSDRLVITASASGTDHAVSVAASATANWKPGRYQWTSYAVNGSTKYRAESGYVEILRDMQAAHPADVKTHARKVLEAIEAVLERRATKDQESYAIAGRTLSRTPLADLMALRDKYRVELAREEAAERGNRGRMRRVFVRFGQA